MAIKAKHADGKHEVEVSDMHAMATTLVQNQRVHPVIHVCLQGGVHRASVRK